MIAFGTTCLLLALAYLVVMASKVFDKGGEAVGLLLYRVSEWLEQDAGFKGAQGASILQRAGLIQTDETPSDD